MYTSHSQLSPKIKHPIYGLPPQGKISNTDGTESMRGPQYKGTSIILYMYQNCDHDTKIYEVVGIILIEELC